MVSTRWGFAGDGGYAWRVLADLDLGGLPVHVSDEGRALEEQPPVSKHVVRHLEVYRRLGHLRIVVLRYGEVSCPVYQTIVRDEILVQLPRNGGGGPRVARRAVRP